MLASLSCLTLKQDRYLSSTSYEAFTQVILDTILATIFSGDSCGLRAVSNHLYTLDYRQRSLLCSIVAKAELKRYQHKIAAKSH